MPRHLITSPRAIRLRRRISAAAVVTATAAVGLGAGSGADAGRRTDAATIAAEADQALAAFEDWEADRSPADYVRFVQSRDQAAGLTAADLDVDAAALRREWASTPYEQQAAVLAAMSQLGVPYRSLASEPGVGFDCSGLTSWAFAQADIELPRVSGDQIDAADAVDHGEAAPGDLVYYPGHIGIYLGLDLYVHSPEPGSTVEARPIPDRSLDYGSVSDTASGD